MQGLDSDVSGPSTTAWPRQALKPPNGKVTKGPFTGVGEVMHPPRRACALGVGLRV